MSNQSLISASHDMIETHLRQAEVLQHLLKLIECDRAAIGRVTVLEHALQFEGPAPNLGLQFVLQENYNKIVKGFTDTNRETRM